VAQMLFDGELDMAMIPSRAWDDLGVTSLSALNAPFLVTTDTLTQAIVDDDELVAQLTSGLPEVGVQALGLYPEGLRHPFGVDGPLLGAEDYEGGVVHAPWSRTANATFGALGATIDDAGMDTGSMIGAEASYRLTPGGTATGNVVFYPKVNVLSIDADVEAGLSEEQRGVLDEAAVATAAWVQQTMPTDAEAARTFCDEAGHIAGATQAQLEGLVAATRSVVDGMRADPTTAALIDAISSMAQDDPEPERVTSCPEPEVDRSSELNGTYTFTATAEAVRAAGGTDQGLIDENTGDFTMTFDDGTYAMDQVYSQGPNAGTTWHGTGGYTFDGKNFQIFYSHEPGAWTKAKVKIRKDGSLVFSKVDDGGGPEEQALSDAWYTIWPRQD
jgi:TRAP-type C4-dicarboxylate transport system substrate-binding protein